MSSPSHANLAVTESPERTAQSPDFYRAFEDRHRGTRELIQQRLRVYLPFIRPLAALHQTQPAWQVLDVGCGRGEWLELLAGEGVAAQGVDTDEGMLAACRERGLSVTCGNALDHMASLPGHSLLAVTGFHLAEHLLFSELQALLAQAMRVLIPGGLLILETPNPENLLVGAAHFYLDPTHERPLPWQLLSYLAEYQGFATVKLMRLQEEARLGVRLDTAPGAVGQAAAGDPHPPERISLYDVLGNVSPDYAIVAQTSPAATAQPNYQIAESATFLAQRGQLADAFARDYGVSLPALANRFDQQASQFSHAQTTAIQAAQGQADLARAQVKLTTARVLELDSALQVTQNELVKVSTAQQQTCSHVEQLYQHLNKRMDQLAAEPLQDCNRAELLPTQMAGMRASRSWQVTRPLRWLTRQFRRLKNLFKDR